MILGLIFFHVAVFGCKTFEANYKLGYWGVQNPYDGNDCLEYGVIDGVLKFGRFVGVFGALLSWLIFAVVMSASCFRYPRPKLVFGAIGGCMLLVSLFGFLLLVGLSTNLDSSAISLAGGGILAIFAAFLWSGAAFSIVFLMKERNREQQAVTVPPKRAVEEPTGRDDTESGVTNLTEVEIVQHPNGTKTKTTTKTTMLPDGSKSIEKTVETFET
jgi:hypothetical protein